MPPSLSTSSPERIRAAFRDLENKFANTPGITERYNSAALPMYSDDEDLFWIDGQPKPTNDGDMSWAIHYVVGPEYLDGRCSVKRRALFYVPG